VASGKCPGAACTAQAPDKWWVLVGKQWAPAWFSCASQQHICLYVWFQPVWCTDLVVLVFGFLCCFSLPTPFLCCFL
jgi:hypothetical protein